MSARPLLFGTLAVLLILVQVLGQGILICQESNGDTVFEVTFSACCAPDGRSDIEGQALVSAPTDAGYCWDCVDSAYYADWATRGTRTAEELPSHDPCPAPCAAAESVVGTVASLAPARNGQADPAHLSNVLRIAASTVMRC